MGLQAGAVGQDEQVGAEINRVYRARVMWYNRMNGYGFMMLDGFPRDVFVHNTEVRAGDVPRDYLLKNDELTCKVALREGRPCCIDLVMVKAAG